MGFFRMDKVKNGFREEGIYNLSKLIWLGVLCILCNIWRKAEGNDGVTLVRVHRNLS